ncbi:glycosyltransferase family 2 protein [Candidatus Microgenomates bacterium]|nr:glycosyltransferase family 2 protein [Candidatus Microgenomates bacterium]
MKLSVVILAKNAEATIKKCIQSVTGVADTIVVVDDESSDQTVSIAKLDKKVTVIEHKLVDFAAQRNFADEQTKADWILHLDADETLSEELAQEIANIVSMAEGGTDTGYLAYYIRRRDFFWGRELRHGETATARSKGFIRLYKRGSGSWKGAVHEHFETNAQTRQLGGLINHHPHQTVAEFLTEVNRYSTWRARELQKSGARATFISLTVLPVAKFVYTYFFKGGFLDGPPGFAYSFMMSFHSFLVRAKLYQYTELS